MKLDVIRLRATGPVLACILVLVMGFVMPLQEGSVALSGEYPVATFALG
jgi:hypothetical protein